MDIFDAKILCTKCNKRMEHKILEKSGASLRMVECPKCKEQIIHPTDLENFKKFNNNLKGKTYNVKLRVVGNSHAVSIPKEMVEFIQNQEKMMNDMVRLCFEDMHKISMLFGEGINEREMRKENKRSSEDWSK